VSLIHNARISLLATTLNNFGVGAIIASVVVPTVNDRPRRPRHILVWAIFGADLIVMAQAVLGRLHTLRLKPIGWWFRWWESP
jgi:hypothetical protein